MKKTLTVLASAVLALGMLFVMGCKMQPELGDIAGTPNWKSDTTYGSETNAGELTIVNNVEGSEKINWIAVTDKNGKVLATHKDLAAGSHPIFKMTNVQTAKDREVVVWMNQDSNTSVKYNKGDFVKKDRTLRGTVKLNTKKGVKITDTKWGEAIQSVGTVKLTCNETAKGTTKQLADKSGYCINGKWHGDYTISQLLPLRLINNNNTPKDITDDTFVIEGNLKYDELDLKEGETIEVIWPAGESYRLAVKQTARFDPSKAGSEKNVTLNGKDTTYVEYETTAQTKQQNWYWSLQTNVSRSQTKAYNSYDTNQPFDGTGKIQKDDLKPDTTKPAVQKSMYDVVIIEGSDFILDAANEK